MACNDISLKIPSFIKKQQRHKRPLMGNIDSSGKSMSGRDKFGNLVDKENLQVGMQHFCPHQTVCCRILGEVCLLYKYSFLACIHNLRHCQLSDQKTQHL
jgi:hypothetical protein